MQLPVLLLSLATAALATPQYPDYGFYDYGASFPDYFDYGRPAPPPPAPVVPRHRPVHHHKKHRPRPRPVVHRAPPPPPPPPAPVAHNDYHAAKKAHDHNLFHGHDPTHGGHTRPHGPHHSKFDKHGHAIGRREAEHTEEAEEK